MLRKPGTSLLRGQVIDMRRRSSYRLPGEDPTPRLSRAAALMEAASTGASVAMAFCVVLALLGAGWERAQLTADMAFWLWVTTLALRYVQRRAS